MSGSKKKKVPAKKPVKPRAAPKRYSFIAPPVPKAAPVKATGGTGDATGNRISRPPAKSYDFIDVSPPTLGKLVGRESDQWTVPPREICDQCGAHAEQVARQVDGQWTVILSSGPHSPECVYRLWPGRVIVENVTSPLAAYLRPSMATEMRSGVSTCGVCRAHGIYTGHTDASGAFVFDHESPGAIENDRTKHLWWCTWWHAHPGVTPF